MLQQHSYKVRCVRSGMLILKATLIVILAPAMTLAQPGSSNPPVSTQAATPASQLTPLSEANCKPSDNPKEEKPSFCGGVGAAKYGLIRPRIVHIRLHRLLHPFSPILQLATLSLGRAIGKRFV